LWLCADIDWSGRNDLGIGRNPAVRRQDVVATQDKPVGAPCDHCAESAYRSQVYVGCIGLNGDRRPGPYQILRGGLQNIFCK